jgi:tetratricopeptide (TPR) repeat protein
MMALSINATVLGCCLWAALQDPDSLLSSAKDKIAAKDFKGAEADCGKAIEANGNLAGAYLMRAYLRVDNLRDYARALADFQKAVELEPKNAKAYRGRARTNYSLGQTKTLIADLDKAIELDPSFADAYRDRGVAHALITNDLVQALKDFTKTIELNPTDSFGYSSRGMIRFVANQMDDAIADFTKAIELNPKHPTAHYERALAHFEKNAMDQALADLDKAFEVNQGMHDQVRLRRWLVKSVKGDREGASAELKQSLKDRRAGEFGDWVPKIVDALCGELDGQKLLDEFDAVKDRNLVYLPACETLYLLGMRARMDGDKEKAIELLKRCVMVGYKTFASRTAAAFELVRLGKGQK